MEFSRYIPDLKKSGILIVAVAYGALILANVATLIPGPLVLRYEYNSNPLAPILLIIIFDTPWTLTGLAGLVLLLGALLFATPVDQRRGLSIFFLCASLVTGVLAGAIWDAYFDTTGLVGAGSSAIAISGQAILCGVSCFGLVRLARQDTRKLGRMTSYWWHSFVLIYATLILTTVWFVVFLQSIFVPTELYNWRVHEIAFILAIGSTAVYGAAAWRSGGLGRGIATDDMLANFHFDDLNDRFQGRLPKLRVVFGQVPGGAAGSFDPGTSSIIVPAALRGRDYRAVGNEFDAALLHGMVHADLYFRGQPWEHGDQAARGAFNALAAQAGAPPEP